MTRKFSWNQCMCFAQVANGYIEHSKGKESKLTYAISRVLSRVLKEQPKITDALADIDIDHCVTGEQDLILRDAQGNLQYTKDSLKKRNAVKLAYLDADNVEIETYYATKLPNDLTVFQIEAFAGFVISEQDAERLMSECEARSDKAAEPELNGHPVQAVSASA